MIVNKYAIFKELEEKYRAELLVLSSIFNDKMKEQAYQTLNPLVAVTIDIGENVMKNKQLLNIFLVRISEQYVIHRVSETNRSFTIVVDFFKDNYHSQDFNGFGDD